MSARARAASGARGWEALGNLGPRGGTRGKAGLRGSGGSAGGVWAGRDRSAWRDSCWLSGALSVTSRNT